MARWAVLWNMHPRHGPGHCIGLWQAGSFRISACLNQRGWQTRLERGERCGLLVCARACFHWSMSWARALRRQVVARARYRVATEIKPASSMRNGPTGLDNMRAVQYASCTICEVYIRYEWRMVVSYKICFVCGYRHGPVGDSMGVCGLYLFSTD